MVLLRLHLSITFGVSHLREPVSQLINRFLKHSDRPTTLMVLRAFAFSTKPEERKNRVRLMNPELTFTNGEEGGVIVVKHNIEGQSFYVTDDEKSIVVQDLLDDLKDKKMSVDFFLSLTNDLATMMTEEDEVGDDPELPEAKEGEDLTQKLLDLEHHLDNAMNRMRKNLMVIRLLGLLSEDDKLQDNLMAESSRMIQFLGASLKRGAMICKKKKEEDDSVNTSIMAVQSLNMVLSILSLHLTQQNVSLEDWAQVQDLVEDLSVLAGHTDLRIARMSGQLKQLILTHGVILNETKAMKEQTSKIKEETEKMVEKTNELKAIKKKMEDSQMDENKEKFKSKAEEFSKAKAKRKESHKEGVIKEEEICEFELALLDISDPMLPVRGHGIIELTKLVEKKDEETISNIGKVGKIFTDSLEDEDTYIYLSAINGLVACARYNTEPVLDA